MPGFKATIPQPNDDLSVSQGDLLLNFQSSNTSFSVDHYPFTDLTVNDGKHNQVTTPIIVGNADPVTVTDLKFYTKTIATTPVALQFSRGQNNAVPTPVTSVFSVSTPIVLVAGASTNVFDFTGINLAFAKFYAWDSVTTNTTRVDYDLWWNGSVMIRSAIVTPNLLDTFMVGNVMTLKNTSGSATLNNVFWALVFTRVQ